MRRQFLASVVLVAAVGCTGDDTGDRSADADAVPLPEVTLRPPPTPSPEDERPGSSPDREEIVGDVGEPVAPFESGATTPAGRGVDADDLLREEQRPPATTPPIDEPTDVPPLEPSVEPLEPGPLAWTVRRTPDPSDRAVSLLVDEGGCDGERSVADRLDISVQETEDRVQLRVARREGAGADRRPCPTAPLTPLTISLDTEVGDRRLEQADGALGPASTPLDDVPGLVSVRVVSDAPPVDPLTSRTVADADLRLILDCDDGRRGPEWRPSTEFATPEIALAEAATELGRSADPWHEFVIDDGDDRGPHRQWIVVSRGSPVGLIAARPAVLGWTATATSCPRVGADFDTELNPDLGTGPDGVRPPGEAPPVTAERLGSLPGLIGLSVVDGALRWDDPSRRCVGWASLEDVLVAAGFVLGSERSVIDPADVAGASSSPDPIVVARQLTRRVDHPDGRAALLTTTADGGVAVTPVATREVVSASRLQPCRLDGDVGSLRVVVR